MSFNLQFNANAVAPNLGMEPLPTNIYTVAITKSEEVPVSGKPGCTYYALTMTVQDGDYKGRTIVDRLNCKNDSQQAVDIAYGTLSSICHVAGIMQVGQSSQELHGRPFKINVKKVQRKDDPSKDGNEIIGYLDMAGNPPASGQGGASPTNGAATAAQAAAFGGATAPVNGAATIAPATVAPATVAAAPAAFPPEGWVAHPSAPGYFYKGQEVLTEAQLREKFPAQQAAPAAPVAPAIPQAPAPAATGAAGTPAIPSWAQ